MNFHLTKKQDIPLLLLMFHISCLLSLVSACKYFLSGGLSEYYSANEQKIIPPK